MVPEGHLEQIRCAWGVITWAETGLMGSSGQDAKELKINKIMVIKQWNNLLNGPSVWKVFALMLLFQLQSTHPLSSSTMWIMVGQDKKEIKCLCSQEQSTVISDFILLNSN